MYADPSGSYGSAGVARRWTTDNVADLFASSTTEMRDVLCAEAVADYLQSIQSASNTADFCRVDPNVSDGAAPGSSIVRARNVLRFIDQHADDLFALLDGEATSTSSRGASTTTMKKSNGAPSVADASSSSSIRKTENSNGKVTEKEKVGASVSTSDAIVSEESTNAATMSSEEEQRALINLTELMSFCIAQSEQQTAIDRVVAACTNALSFEKTLEAQRAFAVQRLLLEAFDSSFEATTKVIADTLTPAIVTGVVENLASNSIVAETLIALFGSALSAVWMVKPTTKTALFTSRWIELGFPARLCDYLTTAICDPAMYHYFYFFKELLKRGYSHSAGPIVDILLGEPLVSQYVEAILSCCEHDVARSPLYTVDMAAAAPVSLAADGMEVLVSVTSLVRKSLILPETSGMYGASTLCISPLKVLEEKSSRITALLSLGEQESPAWSALFRIDSTSSISSTTSPNGTVKGSAARKGFGPQRLAVCELFVELALFQLAETDLTLVHSSFFPVFLRCCEHYAQNDALARCLHRCIVSVFRRPTLAGESLGAAADRDMLWKYLVQPDTISLRCGNAFSVLGAITRLAEVPNTSLSSYCVDILITLSGLPLFQSGAGGPLEAHLAAFRASSIIQTRVQDMSTPITGEDFVKPGSAMLPSPVHRETINLAGERYRGSRTGLLGRGSRIPSITKKAAKGAYIIVRNNSDDDRPRRAEAVVDMDALKQEVRDLQEAGSPQMRSYPSFSSMHLGFFNVSPDGVVEGGTVAPTPADATE